MPDTIFTRKNHQRRQEPSALAQVVLLPHHRTQPMQRQPPLGFSAIMVANIRRAKTKKLLIGAEGNIAPAVDLRARHRVISATKQGTRKSKNPKRIHRVLYTHFFPDLPWPDIVPKPTLQATRSSSYRKTSQGNNPSSASEHYKPSYHIVPGARGRKKSFNWRRSLLSLTFNAAKINHHILFTPHIVSPQRWVQPLMGQQNKYGLIRRMPPPRNR